MFANYIINNDDDDEVVAADEPPRYLLSRPISHRVGRSVRRSVRPSVTLYFFGGFAVFSLTAPAQMIK